MLDTYESYQNKWINDLRKIQQVRYIKGLEKKHKNDPVLKKKFMETAEFNEPDLTIMDRVDHSPQRAQIR